MIISIQNQKGGVGKTTSAVTIAHGLTLLGIPVLLVDLDTQGHCATALGLNKQPGLRRLIMEEAPLRSVIVTRAGGRRMLDLLPADETTEQAKRYLVSQYFSERILRTRLAEARQQVIILDTPPSKDILHVSALIAADYLLIPTRLDSLAIDGVNQVLRSYADIAMQGEGHSAGYSILPTFFERVTKETVTQLQALVDAFGTHVLPPIPADIRAREAPGHGQTLWEYSPTCAAITGYCLADRPGQVGGYRQTLDYLLQDVISHV